MHFEYRVGMFDGKPGVWAPSYLEGRRLVAELAQWSRVSQGVLQPSGEMKLRQVLRAKAISHVVEAPAFFPIVPGRYSFNVRAGTLWVGHFGCCEAMSDEFRYSFCLEHGDAYYQLPVVVIDNFIDDDGSLLWFALQVPQYPRVPVMMCCDRLDE